MRLLFQPNADLGTLFQEMMATLRETLAATEMSDQDRKRIERLENKLFKDLTI